MKHRKRHYYLMNLTYINTSNIIITIFGSNIVCCSYIPFLARVWEDENHANSVMFTWNNTITSDSND